MLFVDFGNVEKVNVDKIRPFTAENKVFPIAGISCELDLPNKPEINAALIDDLGDGTSVETIVKSKIDDNRGDTRYLVEIPSVTDALRSKGLL